MHFARGLRVAGMEVGPGTVLTAIEAVETVGIRRRDDFYWALHAVFVRRHDQQDLFDQAFHLFWRDPRILERMIGLQLPDFGSPPAESSWIVCGADVSPTATGPKATLVGEAPSVPGPATETSMEKAL